MNNNTRWSMDSVYKLALVIAIVGSAFKFVFYDRSVLNNQFVNSKLDTRLKLVEEKV